MKNKNLGNAFLAFIMGCLILYKGTFSAAVGVSYDIQEFKYPLAFFFFSLAAYLIFRKGKIDDINS